MCDHVSSHTTSRQLHTDNVRKLYVDLTSRLDCSLSGMLNECVLLAIHENKHVCNTSLLVYICKAPHRCHATCISAAETVNSSCRDALIKLQTSRNTKESDPSFATS